jgi:hypothetical protein
VVGGVGGQGLGLGDLGELGQVDAGEFLSQAVPLWPDRAICRSRVILARLGDAAAVRRRILLVWSAHAQVRVQVTTGRPSQ